MVVPILTRLGVLHLPLAASAYTHPTRARVAQVGVSGLVPARHPVATQASSSSVRARRLAAVAVLFLLALVAVRTQVAWLAPWRGAPGVEQEAASHQQPAKEQPQPVVLFA